MQYSAHIQKQCSVTKGATHKNAPIPEEGKWVHSKEIKDIYIEAINIDPVYKATALEKTSSKTSE